MKKLIYISSFFFLFILNACDSGESKPINRQSNKPNPIETAKQKDIVLVRSDELGIRAKPIMESSVLAQAKEEEQLVLTGEITSFRDTFDIKGKTYIEPWVKVKNARNRIGWVFRGALKRPGGGMVE